MSEINEIAAPLLALLVGFLASFALTPLTGRLALKLGIIDHPSQDPSSHKKHRTQTPYLGGLALIGGLVAGSAFVFLAAEGIPVRHFIFMIGAGLFLGVVGLTDDVRPLPRSARVIAQCLLAIVAWSAGFGVEATASPILDAALTVLWIVGITNAFNLLDNMDGVSAGLAGIAALSFAAMGFLEALPVLPTVSAALAGAAFGFLVHNRHPAKIFMGDSGALFLGFLVALLGIRLRFDNLPQVTFMVPVTVLGLAILDTMLVVISRLRARRPVFLGGRDHIAHRLVRLGLPIRTSVRLMYLAAISLGWLGLVISRATAEVGMMLLTFVVAMGLFFTWFFLRIPIYAAEGAQGAGDTRAADSEQGPEEALLS